MDGHFGSLYTFDGSFLFGEAEAHIEPGIFVIVVLLADVLLVVLNGLLVLALLELGVAQVLLRHQGKISIIILIVIQGLLIPNYYW